MANVTYTVPNKNGSYDGDMVVKQYTSMIIDAGDVVTVDQPNRGLFILVKGDCTINGTLSMTSKGGFINPTSSGGSDNNSVDANGLRLPFLTSGGSDSLTAADTYSMVVEQQLEVLLQILKLYHLMVTFLH